MNTKNQFNDADLSAGYPINLTRKNDECHVFYVRPLRIQNEKEGCYGVAAAAWEHASLYANNANNVEYAKGRSELNRNRQKTIDNEEAKKREKEDKKDYRHREINPQPSSVEAICE